MSGAIQIQINSVPTISMTTARAAWRSTVLDLWRNLHNIHSTRDLRAWAQDKPVMMAINEHLAPVGMTAVLDMSNRDMVFYAPDGYPLHRFQVGYLIYRTVLKDQNEPVIAKFWE